MVRNRWVDIFLLVLLAASLFVGTWFLMAMRFRTGDVYPHYSSLRTDPLGCKVLYDALDHLASVRVGRHYTSFEYLDPGMGDAVLILGTRGGNLDAMEEDLDRLAFDGARVVVAFREHRRNSREPDGEHPAEDSGEEEPAEIETGEETRDAKSKVGAWHLEMKVSGAVADSTGKYQAELAARSEDLPELITVSSPVYFDTAGAKWQVIYSLEGEPVMLQREIGQGTVVMLSDSYPVSNEALRWELHPRLISWMLSGATNVVFVESHLGVRESQGVMTLVRKYRLTTLLFCFAVIALLAVWKNAVPLVRVPDGAGRDGGQIISEKDQFTGLVSLLKRNIGAGSIVQVCFREAGKGPRGGPGGHGKLEKALKEISGLASGGNDPVKAYNRITEKLSERIKG